MLGRDVGLLLGVGCKVYGVDGEGVYAGVVC